MLYIIGSDHAGLNLKNFIKDFLLQRGFKVLDLAPTDEQKVDYPDYAKAVCETMKEYPESRGILICGSGLGMSIAANRYKHIRATLCTNVYMAKMARAHNDANVLCLGERITGLDETKSILEAFIDGQFDGQRHTQRITKLQKLG